MDLELLVIGDSSAGWQGAVTAAQLGHTVGLIALPSLPAAPFSDLRQIPDEVVNEAFADWPLSRTVKQTAIRLADAPEWQRFARYVKSAWQQEVDLYRQQFLAAGGQIWCGVPEITGLHTVDVARSDFYTVELHAQQMLIATGTQSQRPHFAESDMAGVFDADRVLDADKLPQETCLIGASITGLRAACLLAWWGVRVRVIDGRSLDSLQADEETSDLRSRAGELGVRFVCGEDVIGLQSGARHQVTVILESGRRLETECVWLATGRLGRTAELQLEAAELSADDRGRLWCGAQLRTWTESICAVGDVVGYTPELGSESELVRQAVSALLTTDIDGSGRREPNLSPMWVG